MSDEKIPPVSGGTAFVPDCPRCRGCGAGIYGSEGAFCRECSPRLVWLWATRAGEMPGPYRQFGLTWLPATYGRVFAFRVLLRCAAACRRGMRADTPKYKAEEVALFYRAQARDVWRLP